MELTLRPIVPSDWHPVGVESLEDNALNVVRSEHNVSVIAGPGAGKTELLAQRAAYLLQTGTSPSPRRILAISFKRDAASNLAERVRKRCHPNHAERLDSMTFDAFSKSIVDRFGQALPAQWQPKPDYKIFNPTNKTYSGFLETCDNLPVHLGSALQLKLTAPKSFERKYVLGGRLPIDETTPATAHEWAALRYWNWALHGPNGSFLSFPMLGRLAELLLRANPMARQALALTYSHLFLDEFQDTTQIQYDLVKTIFLRTNTIVTAVGDNKQQIMRWAMAMDNPFAAFERDFSATRIPLLNNYRSAPDLVRIQHVLAKALDAHSVVPVSKVLATVKGNSCEIWNFTTPVVEAEYLAQFVSKGISGLGLRPRDFVILVRQKAEDYAALLAGAFAKHGIAMRNEAASLGAIQLQELLTEELSKLVVSFIRLAFGPASARSWPYLVRAMTHIRGIANGDDYGVRQLEGQLSAFSARLRGDFPITPRALTEMQMLVFAVVEFIRPNALRATVAAYRQGDWMDKVAQAVAQHLRDSSTGCDWTATLDAYEGKFAVPLMTIHKSKGLEYHTVIFVGLDDGAWWSFKNDEIEATAGFFVAFTRAKQRVVFTYCPLRGARSGIQTLYQLLREANVPMLNIG